MNDRRQRREGGQSLVEFGVILPVFMLILLGMLEFGFVFDHSLTVQYASREGARVGAALANGGGPLGCPPPDGSVVGGSPSWKAVDQQIIAAVNRVLRSPGSRVDVTKVSSITIYRAKSTDNSGDPDGTTWNVWTSTPNAGPIVDGTTKLDFSPSATQNWLACTRNNGASPDSIGVSLTYTYKFVTPLGNLMSSFGGQLTISDRTVMALNPSNQ